MSEEEKKEFLKENLMAIAFVVDQEKAETIVSNIITKEVEEIVNILNSPQLMLTTIQSLNLN